MLVVFKLVNKYFWKGMIGPIFAFGLPLIMLLLLGSMLGSEFFFPGGAAISVLTIGLVFMPQSIFEFKNSSLLKRIGTTPINPTKFLITILLFNFLIMILAIVVIFLFSFLVFKDNLYESKIWPGSIVAPDEITEIVGIGWLETLANVDWASFIYAMFLLILLTMIVGLLIASIATSTLFIQSVGITLMMMGFYLAPAVLPVGMISSVDALKYMGYALPFKYPVSLMVESFNGFIPSPNTGQYITNMENSNIWDINVNYVIWNTIGTDRELIVFNKVDKILNHVMPYFFIILFSYFAIGKFSWSTRSSKKMDWNIFPNFMSFDNKQKRIKNSISKPDLNSQYIIESYDITKSFIVKQSKYSIKTKKIIANNNININFKRGEHVAILGGNGAGKTVFVEMIMGLNKPDVGHFKYNYESKKTYQESLGIQFQDSSYPVGLKCKDIILFMIAAYGNEINNENLDKLIKEFGIESFYNKSARSLSGGQQQRLNLLLSIVHKPKLVFLDELSTGLDVKIRTSIKKFIKTFAEENNMTIVLVSHDMNEVDYLADRIIVLKEGSVVSDKSKSEIKSQHSSIEKYLEQYL